jgi:predicted aspartyl protease
VIGSFDTSGCPTIKFKVSGITGKPTEFTALVDTGFSGFLSLPMLSAFPLGLVLSGTMNITLADGSTHVRLTCRGMVEIDGSKKIGLITLETGASDVLVGMEFIAKFNKQLVVCPKNSSIELIDAPAPIPKPVPTDQPNPPPAP